MVESLRAPLGGVQRPQHLGPGADRARQVRLAGLALSGPAAGDLADLHPEPLGSDDLPGGAGRGLRRTVLRPGPRQLTQSNSDGWAEGRAGAGFVGGGCSTCAPSMASSLTLVLTPPRAEKPPSLPPAAVTRWQGTTIGQGFCPRAAPTSRASSRSPSRAAISP